MIEPHADDELPEAVLGAARLSRSPTTRPRAGRLPPLPRLSADRRRRRVSEDLV